MKPLIILLSAWSLLSGSCSSFAPSHTVTQVSTIDALLVGAYDGTMSCRKLLTKGDFGIGTFDRLDGEMLVLDGKVYQVKADGKVYRPPPSLTTPFAAVCRFSPQLSIPLPNSTSQETVKQLLDEKIPAKNTFCAIKITGTFQTMHTRAVPAQKKPYRPLTEIAARQPEFPMRHVSGTIVGFRSPPFVKGIGVPGYHLHFVSDNKQQGGHVLDFELSAGTAEIDICNQLHLVLPEQDSDFHQLDLSQDLSRELKEVEQ